MISYHLFTDDQLLFNFIISYYSFIIISYYLFTEKLPKQTQTQCGEFVIQTQPCPNILVTSHRLSGLHINKSTTQLP